MSIPRITQILEKKTLGDVSRQEFLVAWAQDLSDDNDEIKLELKKLNLQLAIETRREIADEDVQKQGSEFDPD
jgi:hypothetical protein